MDMHAREEIVLQLIQATGRPRDEVVLELERQLAEQRADAPYGSSVEIPVELAHRLFKMVDWVARKHPRDRATDLLAQYHEVLAAHAIDPYEDAA